MTKFQLLAAVAAATLATACAGAQGSREETAAAAGTTQQRAAASTATTPSASTATASFTDAQLRAYTAARSEVEPLQATFASQTPEQQQQTSAQIAAILERHNLDGDTFNAIARTANEDRAFAARVAAAQPDTFSDDSLRAFARASIEIQPITNGLATATEEQRTQATEQIRAILQRNNLDSATYNAIASRAQSDQAFAARVQDLHRQAQAPATSGDSGE